MAELGIAPSAREDLDHLLATRPVPDDALAIVRRSLRQLEEFPLSARAVGSGRWKGQRVKVGPWRWLLTIYWYDEDRDFVLVEAFRDSRTRDAMSYTR